MVFLPLSVFEAALQIRWTRLRRELPVIVTLGNPWGMPVVGVTGPRDALSCGWE